MAMLLGVFLHAAIVYLPLEVPGVVLDRERSIILLLEIGVIHAFRMPLFFVVGGFFAAMIHSRHGNVGFLAHRTRRLFLPLIAGMILVAPISVTLANRRMTGIEHIGAYSPVHLWFLEYLYLFCLAAFVLARLVPGGTKEKPNGRFDCAFAALLQSPWKAALLAVPAAAFLHLCPVWMEVQLPPDLSLVPNIRTSGYYGVFFAFGWFLNRHSDLIGSVNWRVRGSALLAIPTLALTWVLFAIWFQGAMLNADINVRWVKVAGVWLHAMTTWLMIFALIGLFLRRFSHPSRTSRYLADSSYWVYIMHLPLVLWLQFQAAEWNVNVWLKFLFVSGVAMGILLITYQLFVRHTLIGVFLNARRPSASQQ
jgi:glucan biosynthesis protein C